MKRFIYLFVLALSMFILGANNALADGENPKFVVEGNTYSNSSTGGKVSTPPTKTPYTWKDKKGNSYPIYMSASGSCFIIKTSKNTGKDYKNYLGPEVSTDICKKMGKEYRGKKATKDNN